MSLWLGLCLSSLIRNPAVNVLSLYIRAEWPGEPNKIKLVLQSDKQPHWWVWTVFLLSLHWIKCKTVNMSPIHWCIRFFNSSSGLLYLHGTEYKLKHLSLHGNRLDSIDHLMQCLLGLQGLRDVTLSQDGGDNPVCSSPGRSDTSWLWCASFHK